MGINFEPCGVKYTHLSSVHAEHSAMLNLLKINRYRRYIDPGDYVNIIVVRISKDGKIGNSRPCENCIKRLKKFNKQIKIKYVYYSNAEGRINMEHFANMESSPLNKLSSGDRKKLKK